MHKQRIHRSNMMILPLTPPPDFVANKLFKDPRVVSGFGKGEPTEKSSSPGEYVFTVSGAGHYSVEMFGQDDSGLHDALLVCFLKRRCSMCVSTKTDGVDSSSWMTMTAPPPPALVRFLSIFTVFPTMCSTV